MAEICSIREMDAMSRPKKKGIQTLFQRLSGQVRSLIHREDAAIAIEFSLLLPVLAVALVFMGFLAVRYQRSITIEQILHAGAEAAVKDPGPAEVMARLQAAAAIKGYPIHSGSSIPLDKLWLFVGRSCSCPDNWEWTMSTCSQMCTNGRPQVVKYHLNATYKSSFDRRLQQVLANFGIGTHAADTRFQKLVLSR